LPPAGKIRRNDFAGKRKTASRRSTRCLYDFEEVEINAIVYLVLLDACPKSSA
jgi:hypothetical protein